MEIVLIAAVDINLAIGKEGKIPWDIKEDLKFFRQNTENTAIVMGRATYDSIGRPLPNRRNIVITRNSKISIPGCEVVSSVDKALILTNNEDEVMVIGGASLCEQLLPQVNRLYITKIDGEFEGDIYFPKYDDLNWHQVSCESHPKDIANAYSHHFIVLDRAP